MSEAATRVAVLGVEGDARAQLRRALSEFGADIAIEGDPRQLDPQSVSRAAPTFILVSLDEAIEDALDAYQSVFDDPNVTVIFDEAAVTRELGGWELARWARHLTSKLLGDQSAILPAPPADAARLPNHDLQPRPGAPISPEQTMRDARLEDYTHDTAHLARDVPVNEPPGRGAPTAYADVPAAAAPADDAFDAMALDLNNAAIELALKGRAPLEVERTRPSEPTPALDEFSLDVDLSALDQGGASAPDTAATTVGTDAGMDWAALEAGFDLGDFGLAAPAPPPPRPAAVVTPPAPTAALELELEPAPELELEPAPLQAEPQPLQEAEDEDAVDMEAELSALQASLDAATTPEASDDTFDLIEVIEIGDADVADVDESMGRADDGIDLSLLDIDVGDDSAPVNFSQYAQPDEVALDLDPALVAMAAELDAQQTEIPERVNEPDFLQRTPLEREPEPEPEPVPDAPVAAQAPETAAPPPASKSSMFGALELALVDDSVSTPVAAKPSAGPGLDVLDFDALVAGLSLVESDAPVVSTRRGVVAVFAGTGGPDAVRQVLSNLPEDLSVPVLVMQRLEAGNHDRLVPQLAKVCAMPVILAEAERAAAGGAVAVLPTGMGVDVGRHGDVRFAARSQSSSDILAQLAQFGPDLVVVVASGADRDMADALSRCMGEGAAVIGQEPSSCFDCAAADRVKELGGRIGAVGELTAQAVKRWKS
ncbi:MAG: chemotaxis protein CheB [Xanthomonadaceae bacterium]|nr:chemotaxis protein CheB [Xanthomonadaceae bacterium]